jgi:hypothetical protein
VSRAFLFARSLDLSDFGSRLLSEEVLDRGPQSVLFCTISCSRPQWLGSSLLLILLCTGPIVLLCFSVCLVRRPVRSSVLIFPPAVFFFPSYEHTARFELWIFGLHHFCQANTFPPRALVHVSWESGLVFFLQTMRQGLFFFLLSMRCFVDSPAPILHSTRPRHQGFTFTAFSFHQSGFPRQASVFCSTLLPFFGSVACLCCGWLQVEGGFALESPDQKTRVFLVLVVLVLGFRSHTSSVH